MRSPDNYAKREAVDDALCMSSAGDRRKRRGDLPAPFHHDVAPAAAPPPRYRPGSPVSRQARGAAILMGKVLLHASLPVSRVLRAPQKVTHSHMQPVDSVRACGELFYELMMLCKAKSQLEIM
jgi:hypothetical protein